MPPRTVLRFPLAASLVLAGCSQVDNGSPAYLDVADGYAPSAENGERYDGKEISPVHLVANAPVSTFGVDVDTGAYSNVRRLIREGLPVPQAAVRTEEMLNYFRYDYPAPENRLSPFSVATDVSTTPWNPNTRLLRVGLRGYDLPAARRPAANLVLMIDVSGSMGEPDKLPLVKEAVRVLADGLNEDDRVSIVTYSGDVAVLLRGSHDPRAVEAAVAMLEAGGGTAGGPALEMAYALAREYRIEGGINRVLMATDGDFNVGLADNDGLKALVKRNREDGITLTTLGFGQGNYNEAMMEAVADLGNGNHAYIDSPLEARKVLGEELSSTLFTIAKDVKVQVEFNPALVSEYRLIGYENRALREEDFTDDKVDSGEIGAGHQVTALYEIVPAGARGWTSARRYEANRAPTPTAGANLSEIATVRIRYKMPEGAGQGAIEKPVPASLLAEAKAPNGDMAFAVAVAAFGQKLRGDTRLGDFGFADIARLAGQPDDYLRQEFVQLVSIAGGEAASRPRGALF